VLRDRALRWVFYRKGTEAQSLYKYASSPRPLRLCVDIQALKERNMATPATAQKRAELLLFIERALAHEPAVRAVVGIGSLAS
jgi:hypothetical protein